MVTTAPIDDGPDRRAITVGSEFVRQYYTVLNTDSGSVHRFYSSDSAFVYGGLDRPGLEQLPVRGQSNIHQRISDIGFKDPRCKILQIDAMFSEADCVLVQACGELSNDGGPMRRFMQSFLLKPKGEKAYYVLNSIFRYQDEVFCDDLDAVSSDGGAENDQMEDSGSSARIGEEEPTLVPEEPTSMVPPPGYDPQPMHSEYSNGMDNAVNDDDEEPIHEDADVDEVMPEEPEPEVKREPTPEMPKPKSWADMLSRNQAGGGVAPPARQVQTAPPPPQPKEQRPPRADKDAQRRSVPPQGGSNGFGSADRQSAQPAANGSGISPAKPVRDFLDSQQIFVGNLLHSFTNETLKEFFGKFGEVADVRINQATSKQAGRRDVPNFAFVIFKKPESVRAILESRPISIDGHRLNVEEKKTPTGNRERGDRERGERGDRGDRGGQRGGGQAVRGGGGGSRGGGRGRGGSRGGGGGGGGSVPPRGN